MIDLNEISDENELVPVVKSILLNNDTFLLRNYANKSALDELIDVLNVQDVPDIETKFDGNFTGVLPLDDGVLFEQYIYNTDDSLPFNREMASVTLKKIYTRLFKIAIFFGKLCLKSVVSNDCEFDDNNYSSVISRYYHAEDTTSQTLPTGEVFEYVTGRTYKDFLPTGLLTVFPVAKGVRFKPPTVSSDDNVWFSVNDQDCLLLHTGTLLARLSEGKHTTSPLQVSPDFNVLQLSLSLPLSTVMDHKGGRLVDSLLRQQIEELPKAATTLYPRETSLLRLEKLVNSCKELFSVCETVLSLYSISRSTAAPPELYSLLPQVSNMMRKSISQEDFLRMMTLWPEGYIIEANSRCELTVRVPNTQTLNFFANKSRRLQYVELADQWFEETHKGRVIPNDIPLFKVNKRRGSSGTFNRNNVIGLKLKTQNSSHKPSYLSNSKEKYMYPEKNHDSQTNLLERLRERERRSAALLSQRQRQYQQFLAVKVNQVFDILYSLPWGKPYTSTYLSTLIVDSLQDTNNPIGQTEAQDILVKLQNLLTEDVFVQMVEGGLKVYRWDNLNKETLARKIHQEEMSHS